MINKLNGCVLGGSCVGNVVFCFFFVVQKVFNQVFRFVVVGGVVCVGILLMIGLLFVVVMVVVVLLLVVVIVLVGWFVGYSVKIGLVNVSIFSQIMMVIINIVI